MLGMNSGADLTFIAALKCNYILTPMATLLRTACVCVSDSCQSCRGQAGWELEKSDLDNCAETRTSGPQRLLGEVLPDGSSKEHSVRSLERLDLAVLVV